MNGEVTSFLIGTIPLDVMLVVAAVVTLRHGAGPAERGARLRIMGLFGIAILVQVGHFAEEWSTGFNLLYPELLGLPPWSVQLWAGFNVVWIGIWCLALWGLLLPWRLPLFPVWFLAIACVVNGVAHPLLSLVAGGYFPGLWTSPVAGAIGLLLLPRLGRFTGPAGVATGSERPA
jgi:hypothetical protein